MRITRCRGINSMVGYTNLEVEAHKLWKDGKITKGDAYRQIIKQTFTPFAWPGGYTIIFYDEYGNVVCSECARKVYFDERQDIFRDAYYEGSSLYCEECNKKLEASYGDPDESICS